MKKDFLDELKEALEAVQTERDAHGLNEGTVREKAMAEFIRVSRSHVWTLEEKKNLAAAVMALDGMTLEEAEVLRQLEALTPEDGAK